MKLHFVLLGLLPLALFAQSDALYQFDVAIDPLEVRMLPLTDDPEPESQRAMRAESGWNDWADNHPRWQAIMSEATGLPHRAFGPAVEIPGATVAEKAAAFAARSALRPSAIGKPRPKWANTPGRTPTRLRRGFL